MPFQSLAPHHHHHILLLLLHIPSEQIGGFSVFVSGSIRRHFNYSPLFSALSNVGAPLFSEAAEKMETFNKSDFKHLLALLSLKIQTLSYKRWTESQQQREGKSADCFTSQPGISQLQIRRKEPLIG